MAATVHRGEEIERKREKGEEVLPMEGKRVWRSGERSGNPCSTKEEIGTRADPNTLALNILQVHVCLLESRVRQWELWKLDISIGTLESDTTHSSSNPRDGLKPTRSTECFKDRTDVQCLHRWQKVLNPELVKGPWSKEVSQMFAVSHGYAFPCFLNIIHLLYFSQLSILCNLLLHDQEDDVIIRMVEQYGAKKWSAIAQNLPGRIGKQCRERSYF
ncbi:hypothetical protein OSB04_019379 [Centaurea solstitialis]|uniref:Uncharacterized protein n=1 Tax=Centaurea solstitialis TaxID=347529 RepID=A0AA38T1Q4_9ASTR|nr:hypothetical protein OSB04_019379 [Centaurea solstitialis]